MPRTAAMFQTTPLAAVQVPERWAVRLLSLLLWLLAAGLLTYWMLGSRNTASLPAARVADTTLRGNAQQLASLLGQASTPAASAAPVAANQGQFALKGVVYDQAGGGLAVIAVGSQPGRPIRVGQEVADGWSVRAIGRRSAQLQGPGGQQLELGFPASGTQAALGVGAVPAFGAAAAPAPMPPAAAMALPAMVAPGPAATPVPQPGGPASGVAPATHPLAPHPLRRNDD